MIYIKLSSLSEIHVYEHEATKTSSELTNTAVFLYDTYMALYCTCLHAPYHEVHQMMMWNIWVVPLLRVYSALLLEGLKGRLHRDLNLDLASLDSKSRVLTITPWNHGYMCPNHLFLENIIFCFVFNQLWGCLSQGNNFKDKLSRSYCTTT